VQVNPLTPNDSYRGRTAALTSKCCILCIYSTSIGTEYFKHGIYRPFFSSSKCSLFHNSNVFGSCIIHILYTECAKIKKNNSGSKRLKKHRKFAFCDRAWPFSDCQIIKRGPFESKRVIITYRKRKAVLQLKMGNVNYRATKGRETVD